MKKNYNAIDLMKFVSAFIVIIVHTYPFYTYMPTVGFISSNILGRVVIPFFFIAAGYFFQLGNPTPARFKKYITKLIKLYCIWSILYIPFGIHRLNNYMDMTPFLWAAGSFFALINFGTYYHLWYMAALIFAIIFCYYYLKKFSMKSLLIVGFVLFAIGCLETYYGFLPEGIFKEGFNRYLALFFTTRNGLFFGILFVSLGMFIAQSNIQDKIKHVHIYTLFFFIALCIEAFSIRFLGAAIDYNFYFMVVPFSFFWFITLLNTQLNWNINFHNLRDYSVIIYFSHGIFLELNPLLLNLFHLSTYWNSGLFRLLSVLFPTLIISYIIKHYIPLLR